jgi:hypothetical protein
MTPAVTAAGRRWSCTKVDALNASGTGTIFEGMARTTAVNTGFSKGPFEVNPIKKVVERHI